MHYRIFVAVVSAACFAGLPAAAQQADPPARVGRVASVAGAVSFHLAGAERWDRASLNLPLTDGAALWTQPGAAATIGIAGDRIALDAATEFDLDRLDERTLVVTQPQGESYWRLLTLPSGDSATVQTPRGIVAFGAAGRYEVISGDTEHPTEITVLEGSAKVTGLPADVTIGPNQTLTITGDGATTPFAPSLQLAVRDAFLQRMLVAERPPAHRVALPPAVALMTGSDVLADEGDWRQSPEYGAVWYPPAPAGFVPYRDGHWAFVAPWGWTWVDDAPWGFAPSHYGRWADIDGRWGWVPGREWAPERPPVYAPALVAFIAGATVGSWVGWAPLGPHQVYRPAYNVSPGYVEALNRPTGAVTNVTNVTTFNTQSITVVPAQAMTSSANVAQAFRTTPPPPGTTAAMQAVQFRAPVAPTRTTVGATAAVLREAIPGVAPGAAPGAVEAPARPAAPGPVIGPAMGPAVAPPGHVGAALLGGAAVGGAAAALLRPSAPGAAPLRPSAPGAALPELRPNGVVRSAVPGSPFTPPPSGVLAPTAPSTPSAPTSSQTPPVAQIRPATPPATGGISRPQGVPGQPAPDPILGGPQATRPILSGPTPPRPEPAQVAPAHPEPARVERPRIAAPRVEPPHPAPVAPLAQVRQPMPVPHPVPPPPLAQIRQPAPAPQPAQIRQPPPPAQIRQPAPAAPQVQVREPAPAAFHPQPRPAPPPPRAEPQKPREHRPEDERRQP